MLRNKLKVIALMIVMIVSLTIPVVRAENETSTDETSATQDETVVTSENTEENAVEDASTNMKKGDVYLSGDDVTVDYIVDGNLYVFAKSVTINSQIGGDVFAFAETVNVGEQGYVFSNLFTCAKTVNVSGVVYDLYAAAQDVQINGYIYRDIRVASNSLYIKGTVGRNAFVQSNNITFATAQEGQEEGVVSSTGIVNGNFEYGASKEISIPEGAVAGETKYTPANAKTSNGVKTYMLSLGTAIATAIIIWLLCLWLAPKFLNNTNTLLTKKVPALLGYGISVPVLATVAFVILAMLGITSKIAIIELMLLAALVGISSSVFVIAANNIVCNKLKIEKNIGIFGMLIVSSAVLWLICLIPYVGIIVKLLASILGLGIITKSVLPSNVKKSAKEVKKVDKKDK